MIQFLSAYPVDGVDLGTEASRECGRRDEDMATGELRSVVGHVLDIKVLRYEGWLLLQHGC